MQVNVMACEFMISGFTDMLSSTDKILLYIILILMNSLSLYIIIIF